MSTYCYSINIEHLVDWRGDEKSHATTRIQILFAEDDELSEATLTGETDIQEIVN